MKLHSKGTFLFTLLLLLFTLAVVLMSFNYGQKTRLMPLIVGIPTLLLAAFLVLVQFYPGLQHRFDIDVFSVGRLRGADIGEQTRKGSLLFHTFLLFFFFALVLLLGFLIATPLYLLTFFRISGRQSWAKSIIATGVVSGLLYLLFAVLMGLRLFEGLLLGGRI